MLCALVQQRREQELAGQIQQQETELGVAGGAFLTVPTRQAAHGRAAKEATDPFTPVDKCKERAVMSTATLVPATWPLFQGSTKRITFSWAMQTYWSKKPNANSYPHSIPLKKVE